MFSLARRKTFRAAAAAVSAAALSLAAQPAFADEAAEQYVQGILDEAEPVLTSGDREAMLNGIDGIVDEYVDMRRIARFVLGQHARRLTEAQEQAYYPLFEQYAKNIYRKTLGDYAGGKIVVTGSIDRSERDIIVNSKLANPEPGSSFANTVIHWRVYRDRDGEMGVVDAGADNVWLAIEQRSQFNSIISNNGGGEKGVDALIAELKKRVNS